MESQLIELLLRLLMFFKVDTFTATNYNNLSLVAENLASIRYDQLHSHEKLRTRISVAKQPIKLVLALTFITDHKREYYTLQQNKFLITFFQMHVANANFESRKRSTITDFFFLLINAYRAHNVEQCQLKTTCCSQQ